MATTRKTATSTPSEPTEEVYDFDSWDEDAEEKAIAEAVKAVDVKYIIIEGRTFVARFPDGKIIKAPLKVSIDDIEAVQATSEDQIEQVKSLLRMFGEEMDVEMLGSQNLSSVVIFAEKYFRVFQRIGSPTSMHSMGISYPPRCGYDTECPCGTWAEPSPGVRQSR